MGKVVRKKADLDKLKIAIKGLDGARLQVGFLESAKYADGTPVAQVAIVQEFGTDHIPPRPFMRTTAAEKTNEWVAQFGKGAKAVANGRLTTQQVMDAMGLAIAGDIKKTIAGITSPPLKESTVKARQRRYADKKTRGNLAKPLVDTAVMINSVTHLAEGGDK